MNKNIIINNNKHFSREYNDPMMTINTYYISKGDNKVQALPMNGENQTLVTDEPVEFEK